MRIGVMVELCQVWFVRGLLGFDKRIDGGTEGEVLEMKGGIREQGAKGEPQKEKSARDWGRR